MSINNKIKIVFQSLVAGGSRETLEMKDTAKLALEIRDRRYTAATGIIFITDLADNTVPQTPIKWDTKSNKLSNDEIISFIQNVKHYKLISRSSSEDRKVRILTCSFEHINKVRVKLNMADAHVDKHISALFTIDPNGSISVSDVFNKSVPDLSLFRNDVFVAPTYSEINPQAIKEFVNKYKAYESIPVRELEYPRDLKLVLTLIRDCVYRNADMDSKESAIIDTIWMTDHVTLIDFIDAYLNEVNNLSTQIKHFNEVVTVDNKEVVIAALRHGFESGVLMFGNQSMNDIEKITDQFIECINAGLLPGV